MVGGETGGNRVPYVETVSKNLLESMWKPTEIFKYLFSKILRTFEKISFKIIICGYFLIIFFVCMYVPTSHKSNSSNIPFHTHFP